MNFTACCACSALIFNSQLQCIAMHYYSASVHCSDVSKNRRYVIIESCTDQCIKNIIVKGLGLDQNAVHTFKCTEGRAGGGCWVVNSKQIIWQFTWNVPAPLSNCTTLLQKGDVHIFIQAKSRIQCSFSWLQPSLLYCHFCLKLLLPYNFGKDTHSKDCNPWKHCWTMKMWNWMTSLRSKTIFWIVGKLWPRNFETKCCCCFETYNTMPSS